MKKASLTLTVVFEQPFWVGVFEYRHSKELSVAKVTFGKEPKQNEIYAFVLTQFDQLVFSPVIEIESLQKKKINPKRLQKLAKKQVSNSQTGTKSQQALKRQLEERKVSSRKKKREEKLVKKKKQFALKQRKRAEKHKGH